MALHKRVTRKKTPPSRRSADREFSPSFFDANRAAIAAAMRANLKKWGAHGWSVVGRAPKLRLEVAVPRTVQNPRYPVQAIRVSGRRIKPTVRASFVHLRSGRTDGAAGGNMLSNAVAPGARIRIGRGIGQELVGIAAVLSVNGRLAILTCGHAGAFDVSDEVLPGAEADASGRCIATLDHNFFNDPNPLDAALCSLTDAGLDLLAQSRQAPTWRFESVRLPSAVDNEQMAVFWDTHDESDDAPTAKVHAFSCESRALFGTRGPNQGFIQTAHHVVGGDSGSLLSVGSELYGICSGNLGFTGLFTPIHAVISRLQEGGKQCSVHIPAG